MFYVFVKTSNFVYALWNFLNDNRCFLLIFPLFGADWIKTVIGIFLIIKDIVSLIALFTMKDKKKLHIGRFVCKAILSILLGLLLLFTQYYLQKFLDIQQCFPFYLPAFYLSFMRYSQKAWSFVHG